MVTLIALEISVNILAKRRPLCDNISPPQLWLLRPVPCLSHPASSWDFNQVVRPPCRQPTYADFVIVQAYNIKTKLTNPGSHFIIYPHGAVLDPELRKCDGGEADWVARSRRQNQDGACYQALKQNCWVSGFERSTLL